jgi:hypothetical protein
VAQKEQMRTFQPLLNTRKFFIKLKTLTVALNNYEPQTLSVQVNNRLQD